MQALENLNHVQVPVKAHNTGHDSRKPDSLAFTIEQGHSFMHHMLSSLECSWEQSQGWMHA